MSARDGPDGPDDGRDRLSGLGGFIRQQRAVASLSLRRLSELAGVSNPYLSQIERGLRTPSAQILQQLARGLRISAETLYVQAGILEDRPPEDDLDRRILADPHLSEDQRQALVAVYWSFRLDHGDSRRPSGEARPTEWRPTGCVRRVNDDFSRLEADGGLGPLADGALAGPLADGALAGPLADGALAGPLADGALAGPLADGALAVAGPLVADGALAGPVADGALAGPLVAEGAVEDPRDALADRAAEASAGALRARGHGAPGARPRRRLAG